MKWIFRATRYGDRRDSEVSTRLNLFRRGFKGLPRGAPPIIGALLVLPILLLLAALHVRLGPIAFAVNWTTFLTFVLVGVIIFVVARANRRPRG